MDAGDPRSARPTSEIEAFEALFRQHQRAVRSYVAHRVLPNEVDDVVAETFTTVWRRRSDLPEHHGVRRAWLLRTANYTSLNHRRGRQRWRILVEKASREGPSDPREALEDPSSAVDAGWSEPIEQVLRDLAPADRALLLLVASDELSTGELARTLGCTEGAARTRLSRARARFRARALQARPPDPPPGATEGRPVG